MRHAFCIRMESGTLNTLGVEEEVCIAVAKCRSQGSGELCKDKRSCASYNREEHRHRYCMERGLSPKPWFFCSRSGISILFPSLG